MGKTLKECYEVLGLDSSATEDEIKSAYRQKALKCHPDKNPDDPLSTQKFQELGHAYRRLMGEEDSDDDDDENDYDSRDNMELWRDFFYFLFREEIIAKARCQCYTCRRHGDEDDDFLASLVKNQEKEQQFTEEEMAQFTSFANLKEQKEANKQKFCNKNLSSSKPEQRTNKGHKPKLKSNRELKREQWKREQEITEIAAQIKQTSIVQEKTSSKASKNIDLQEKRPLQHVDVDPKHSAKEHTGAANKRNTRKKRNRNKSKMQDNQETDTRQKNGHRDTTSFTKQKMSSTLVIKDVMGNVAIKPETTRRQDDVTGRLPHHTSFSSRRMMQSSGANAAFRSQKSTFHKQTGKGWFENPGPQVSSTSSYDANIWEKRQQKQQFLAELQPSNQADEELQFQMALELSKKQAEIDAQQREISVLEKEMEETLEIEKEFELKSVQNKSGSSTASNAETNTIAAIFDDEFPPLVYEQGPDGEEEWMVASGSEDEWGDYTCGNDGDESEACLTEFSDSREEHTVKLPAQDSEITERDNKTVSTTHVQLPQNPRNQNAKALDCPYGKNCCLGKRCKYSHSSTIDTGSRSKSVDNSFSQDRKSLGKSGRNADSHLVHNIAGNLASDDITFGASYEELPMSGNSDMGPSTGNNGTSSTGGSIIIIANHSIQDLPKEVCAPLISKASNKTADQYSQQANAASGSYTGEDFKCTSNVSGENAVTEDQMGVPGEEGKPSSPLPLRTLNQPITSVVQVSNLSCSSGTMNQSADSMPQLTILPASCSDLKEPPNSMPQLSNLTVDASAQNYSPQVPLAAVSSTVTPPATASGTQGSDYTSTIPGTLSVTSKNATSTSEAHIVQTSSTSQQPNTPIASLSTSPLTVNSFPAVPAGFPLLPFGNLSPILNPTNVTSFSPTLSTTQMAASGLHGITLAAVRPPCNGVQNPQGLMAPPYYTNQPNCSGLPAAGQYIPMSPLNGFPGLKATDLQRGHDSAKVTGFASSQPPPPPGIPQITGLRGMPRTCKPPSLQAGFATNPLSTAQARVQLKGFVGLPFGADMLQFSQAGLSTAQPTPLSVPQLLLNGVSGIPVGANMPAVVTNPQLIRYPFSMINPQVSVNMETEMASKGIPQSIPQDSSQTEKSATLQVQGSKEQKPAEVRSDTGQQKQGPSDGGTKAPLLRRPATMPKVIQHQVST